MPRNSRFFSRRALPLLAASVLALSLAGCATSGENDAGADDERPVVLTTFTVLADIAENVAGDNLRVESITKVGAEIHGYEPTPGDIRRASEADLILDNGMNLEAWFGQFVEGLDVPHVVVSEGVEAIDITEDAYAGMPNPHAWMSPVNVQIYVDNMVDAFSDLDPDNASEYEANGEAYKAELQTVQDELVDELSVLPDNQRALVTCEGAFSYLARDAGLTEKYIWAVNAEQQATPQQITSAIEFVRDNDVPAVFCESTVSRTPRCSRSSKQPMPSSAACCTSIPSPKRTARSRPTWNYPPRRDHHHRRSDGTQLMTTAISVHGVTVHYGEVLALDHATLDVQAGRVCGLIGMNGSGKVDPVQDHHGTAAPRLRHGAREW